MYVRFFFPEIVSYAQLGPVVYKDKEVIVSNPTDFPDVGDMGIRVKEIQEPVVKASIIVPEGLCSPYLLQSMLLISAIFDRIFRRYDGPLLLTSGWRTGASLFGFWHDIG